MALSQNGLVQPLVQDVIRRMLNCSEHVLIETGMEIIDNFGQKMLNSGHQIRINEKEPSQWSKRMEKQGGKM